MLPTVEKKSDSDTKLGTCHRIQAGSKCVDMRNEVPVLVLVLVLQSR